MLLHRLSVKLKPTLTFLSGIRAEIGQDPDTMGQTMRLFWSHIWTPDHLAWFFFHLICRKRAVQFDWDTPDSKLHWTWRSHWLTLQGLSELSAHTRFAQWNLPLNVASYGVPGVSILVWIRATFWFSEDTSLSAKLLTQHLQRLLSALKWMWGLGLWYVRTTELTHSGFSWNLRSQVLLCLEISPRIAWKTVNKSTISSSRDQKGDQIHKSKLEKQAYGLPYLSHNKYQTLYIPPP